MFAMSALKKYWKPVLVTGAGGTSLVIWFEEIVVIGLDLLAVLAVLLVVGPIYIFDHYLFKSTMPRREDKYK